MASAKVKARLKALRKKFGLGEFKSSRAIKKPKATRRKRSFGGIKMARGRKHFGKKSGVGGLMTLAKYAVEGIGSATVVSQMTGGKEYTPFFHELSGAAGAGLMHKNVKAAIVGGLAVAALKKLPDLTGNLGATSASVVLN